MLPAVLISGQFLLGLEAQFGPNYTAHEVVVGCIAAQEHVRNM